MGGGDGGLTRATMRSACGLEQELPAPRSAGGLVVTLPQCWAGPLLGVPCQQAAPGCMASRQGQGPTRRVQTAEDNGVLEGITGQGRSGVLLIPSIPVAGGIRPLFGAGEPVGPLRVFPETLVADRGLLWCENLGLIGHLTKLQQVCDQKANPRYRGVPNAAALSERKEWAIKARKYRSHLMWMAEVRRRVLDMESDNMADTVLSQGGTSVSSQVQYEYKSHDYGRRVLDSYRCAALQQSDAGEHIASWDAGLRHG